jgi:hypothetical protein
MCRRSSHDLSDRGRRHIGTRSCTPAWNAGTHGQGQAQGNGARGTRTPDLLGAIHKLCTYIARENRTISRRFGPQRKWDVGLG